MSATYLDRIIAHHRARAGADERELSELIDRANALAAPTRGFRASLVEAVGLGVIAEIKRRSPSKGDLHADLEPAQVAREYERGCATCLSVLTDLPHFGGSVEDLQAARGATSLPVLRKDFTVAEIDVCDARLMGADAVLLIAAALDDDTLGRCAELGRGLGLDVLVEIHDERELGRAVGVGADLVGVNQRDLATFEVDRGRAVRMAGQIPTDVVRVAESGVRGPHDAATLAAAGYDAVLVGESLVTAGDPAAATRALRAVGRPSSSC